jgi:hypothetical protein
MADNIINVVNALTAGISATWQALVDRGIGRAELTAAIHS